MRDRNEVCRIVSAVAEPAVEPARAAVDLYWLPLGAGGHVVRLNGKVYERLCSLVERRAALDLYHSALVVRLPEGDYSIESTPVPDDDGHRRGVVAGGPVGSRWAGRLRLFRYEVRCWRGGVIPDLAHAVESPARLSEDPVQARRILQAAPRVPAPCVGPRRPEDRRDVELQLDHLVAARERRLRRAGDRPPARGRAPGWDAGLVVARRQGA